ncbi:MAG: hypothetical protein ACODAU_09115 [Myxococcota bacterium]
MNDGSGDRGSRDTVRGFSTSSTLDRGRRPESTPEPARGPEVHVEHIRESGSPRLLEGRWRAYEIWTAQRIYVLGDDLECMEVIDRGSGTADADNQIVGARLVGGEARDDTGRIAQVSHPLPHPGARAVFAKPIGERQRMSETSAVTRVVLRQRVVTIAPPRKKRPSWRDITGRHELP